MEIRRLTHADAEALWSLRLQALETDPKAFTDSAEEHRRNTVESFAERLRLDSGESFVIGAFDDGKLVGMAGFYRDAPLKRRHKGRVWGVYVTPSHRRRGISRALMSSLIDGAREIGVSQIQLSLMTSQKEARELYASLGFRSWGLEPSALHVNGEFVDEEYMVLL